MPRDNSSWPTPAPTHPPAAGGLIKTAQAQILAANQNGNYERAGSYVNLLAAAEHFLRVLQDFNPQADSAVITEINALKALI